jgi:hypothetical protein
VRTAAPQPARQLVMRDAKVLKKLLVGGRLLQRVELDPVDVLEQCIPQQRVVRCVPHDGRDGGQAGGRGRAPTPFAHDQLVFVVRGRPHDNGLQNAELADRVGQLGQRVLIEDGPGLPRVSPNRADRELQKLHPWDADEWSGVARGSRLR